METLRVKGVTSDRSGLESRWPWFRSERPIAPASDKDLETQKELPFLQWVAQILFRLPGTDTGSV